MKRIGILALLLLSVGCSRSKTTEELIAQAKTADEAARLRAIHELSAPDKDAAVLVPVLTDALRDDNYYVRRDAARTLRRFGPEARDAVPALVVALKDREPSVRRAAANALAEIDPAAVKKYRVR
jgi:HEAT repeat protein